MTHPLKRIRAAIVVFLAITAGYFLYTRMFRKPQQENNVYFGNVDIRDVTLSFRVPGRIDKVLKDEGERVEPGELLAELDKAPYRLALEQARAAFDVASAQLKNVEAGARREDISQARAALVERKAGLTRAEDTFERIKRLEATGAATTQALTDAKAAVEQSLAAVAGSGATLQKLVNGARSEELQIAHAQAVLAQVAVEVAELNLDDSDLRAKSKGIIVTRAIEPGAMVQTGTPALVVAFEDPVWIRAFAPEMALALLAPGTKVEVISDARPSQPYEGRVGFVSPQAEFTPKTVETEELRSSLVYRFRVVVEHHGGGLRQGMPVTIRKPKDSGAK